MGRGTAGDSHVGAMKINCKGSKTVKPCGKCNVSSKQSASSCAAPRPCCARQPPQAVRTQCWALSTQTREDGTPSSAKGSAARSQPSVPTPGTRCSIAGHWVGSPLTGQSSLGHPGLQPAPGGPGSPPLPGADRATARLCSFSCNTHTCSGSVQVCILKITTVCRQKESLF